MCCVSSSQDRLLAACQQPHHDPDSVLAAVAAALADGASVNDEGAAVGMYPRETALSMAVMTDQHAVVSYLLSRGANPSGRPLVLACGQKSAALVQLLLTAECDVNAPVNGETPLFYAIASDIECADKVEALLGQQSLNLKATNRLGMLAEDEALALYKPHIAVRIAKEVSVASPR